LAGCSVVRGGLEKRAAVGSQTVNREAVERVGGVILAAKKFQPLMKRGQMRALLKDAVANAMKTRVCDN